jgi:hypothetical protein
MQAAQCRKLLVSSRAAVGWVSVLAPNLVGRAWRIQLPLDSNVKYAIRLFGARNALLAYQLYQAERSDAAADELEEVLRQGLAVDAFDVLFGLAYRRANRNKSFTAAIPVVASMLGFVLGFFGREQHDAAEKTG